MGLDYICTTAERFFAVEHVLRNMVAALSEQPSSRLLKHIIRCYLQLSNHSRLWCYPSLYILSILLDRLSVVHITVLFTPFIFIQGSWCIKKLPSRHVGGFYLQWYSSCKYIYLMICSWIFTTQHYMPA